MTSCITTLSAVYILLQAQEVYRNGVMYYNTQSQQPQRSNAPLQKRPKAAIPILPPPEHHGNNTSTSSYVEEDDTDDDDGVNVVVEVNSADHYTNQQFQLQRQEYQRQQLLQEEQSRSDLQHLVGVNCQPTPHEEHVPGSDITHENASPTDDYSSCSYEQQDVVQLGEQLSSVVVQEALTTSLPEFPLPSISDEHVSCVLPDDGAKNHPIESSAVTCDTAEASSPKEQQEAADDDSVPEQCITYDSEVSNKGSNGM